MKQIRNLIYKRRTYSDILCNIFEELKCFQIFNIVLKIINDGLFYILTGWQRHTTVNVGVAFYSCFISSY